MGKVVNIDTSSKRRRAGNRERPSKTALVLGGGGFTGGVYEIGTLRALALDYQAQGKKLAVWGAGHRTLALLALAGLSDVAYVIDSAKFKQGKFTPVLHLKIVPPSQLKNEPVDLVLVMVPGLYPGEVLKTLAGMGIGSAVAALRGNELELMVKE